MTTDSLIGRRVAYRNADGDCVQNKTVVLDTPEFVFIRDQEDSVKAIEKWRIINVY